MTAINVATDRPLYYIMDYAVVEGKTVATLKHRFQKERKQTGPYYLIRF